MPRFILTLLAYLALTLCGCPRTAPPATFHSEEGHTHEMKDMLPVDVPGADYHAALTAHLSGKDGNELDIFFLTTDEPPMPVPLPVAKFTATAKTADGKGHALEFEPTPIGERKDDPEGKCSHFVAKAGWMKPEDVLNVTATVTIGGKPTSIQWKDFSPKKYAHHVE